MEQNLNLALSSLRSVLRKPLRPFWVTPHSMPHTELIPSSDYHTILCCTASRRVYGAEMTEDGYIQGAGDDSEGWSNGLTPALFWRHSEQLLAAVEEDMPDLIQELISMDRNSDIARSDAVKIGPTGLCIGTSLSTAQAEQYDGIIICGGTTSSKPDQETEHHEGRRCLYLPCGDGKLGSRALRSQLPHIPPFIASLPDSCSSPRLLLVCSTGKDLSVGIGLALLCLFYDDTCRSLTITYTLSLIS